jgi:hypothetical protein
MASGPTVMLRGRHKPRISRIGVSDFLGPLARVSGEFSLGEEQQARVAAA